MKCKIILELDIRFDHFLRNHEAKQNCTHYYVYFYVMNRLKYLNILRYFANILFLVRRKTLLCKRKNVIVNEEFLILINNHRYIDQISKEILSNVLHKCDYTSKGRQEYICYIIDDAPIDVFHFFWVLIFSVKISQNKSLQKSLWRKKMLYIINGR